MSDNQSPSGAVSPITLVGGDLDDLPPFAEPILMAVGLAAFHWARLEQHLDTLLISVNKEYFSKEKFDPTPNTSFQLKIKLFKKWFVIDPRFSAYKNRAKKLAVAFKEASADRHLLFHSNLQRFEKEPTLTMIAINVHIKGENVVQSRCEWTVGSILNFARNVAGLNRGLRTISHEVLKPEFLSSLENT